MNAKFESVKGILFDYGGTLDTNGLHWAEVLWTAYEKTGVPVTKAQFREAYVHGERTLAVQPLIESHHNFYDVLCIKAQIQIAYLVEKGWLHTPQAGQEFPLQIATLCNDFAKETTRKAGQVVQMLTNQYKLALVSNFYGNIHSILKNFSLLCSFEAVIESAVVGVRKPDPEIFVLGVKALRMKPEETVVIGDSFTKDILPARQAGCRTIWLKGKGWDDTEEDESIPDAVIHDIAQVKDLLL